MFSALRYRDYRFYWFGGVISYTGSWVQMVCYGWLIYDITDSKLWLGLIGFIGALPLSGLTLFGGAIADRVDKRRMLMLTQVLFALLALALGLLLGFGVINRYHILVIAFIQGIVMSFDAPVRHSMPAQLVAKKDLMNAIVLNSAAFNGARIVGPAVAGILVVKLGLASCFYINAASYLAVIAALLVMDTRTPAVSKSDGSVFNDVGAGLRYIRAEPRIFSVMIVLAVSSLFVMPYVTLIPIFAKDILKMGIEGNAALLTSIGIGAVIGALLLAALSNMENRGRILVFTALLGGLLLIAFANSHNLIWSQLALVGLGFAVVSFNQTSNTLVQTVADDAFRGRVMSAYIFVFMGLSPLANLQAGVLAQAIGAPATVTLWGILFIGLGGYIATRRDVLDL